MKSELKAKYGIGFGLGLEVLSRLLAFGGTEGFLFALVIFVFAVLLLIWGCTHYAIAKGLPQWLGYLGLLSLLGPVVIYLLPSRCEAEDKKIGQ